jgi:DNA-binding CsgD family transcriptional regulator
MEIGQILDISEDTVKSHIRCILTKLDAMGRTEAIAIAAKRGLIQAGYLQDSLSYRPPLS